MAWTEIGERVFVRRHASFDLNVGLVVGGERCLVIDTRESLRAGSELASAVRAVTALPGVVVNTHAHFDHFLGNAAFPGAPIWATRRCAEAIEGYEGDSPVVVPTHTFETARAIDLGGRIAELRFAGRGHTDNDLVVTAGAVTFAGDLVEEGAPPAFEDAYPFEWPATLDALIARAPAGPAVPGHGAVVDWDVVRDQRDLLASVADAGRSGDWSRVDLPADVARIARERCVSRSGDAPSGSA